MRLAPSGLDAQRYWAAGTAPILEIIAARDPFHSPDQWGDLRAQLGARVIAMDPNQFASRLMADEGAKP